MRNSRGKASKRQISPGRVIRKVLIIIMAGFFLLSILPYSIPIVTLDGERESMVFDNSMFFDTGGVALHYRAWSGGPQEKGRVLLVHGFGASTFSWRYTVPALQAEGFSVVAVDLPGFGLSERRQGLDHTAGGRASAIWALLDEAAPGAGWHLVGHSMGGATVAAMYLQAPERVDSLTFAAGALLNPGLTRSQALFHYPPAAQWARVISSRVMSSANLVERMLTSAYGRQPSTEDLEGYFLPLTLKNSDIVLVDLLQQEPVPPPKGFDSFNLPVLLIWGEKDSWVPLRQGRELARQVPGAELIVIPGEGHCPMETAPEAFNEELIRFFRQQ